MKLTIDTTVPQGHAYKSYIIEPDNELQQIITSLVRSFSQLSDAAATFARVVERETKAAE